MNETLRISDTFLQVLIWQSNFWSIVSPINFYGYSLNFFSKNGNFKNVKRTEENSCGFWKINKFI